MSYLTRYLVHRSEAPAPVTELAPRRSHVAERLLLNYPGFYAGAYVEVFVEDTSAAAAPKRGELPQPRLHLEIADCDETISLEFELVSAEARENALHKIDTLLGALARFRDGLAAEAAFAAKREYGRRAGTDAAA